MNSELTNTDGEKTTIEVPENDEIFVTGTSFEGENNPEIDNITTTATTQIEEAAQQFRSMNREQRRAVKKKMGKKGREEFDLIADTAKKLNYIDLIQKLRKLNEEKENEEDEATKD